MNSTPEHSFSSDQLGRLLGGLNGIYDSGTIDSLLTSLRTHNIISEAKMGELLVARSKDKNESVRLLYSIIVTHLYCCYIRQYTRTHV
jgi:hypothetical protein